MTSIVIVPAAGLGERMGADKALLDLGGSTAIERIVLQLSLIHISEPRD